MFAGIKRFLYRHRRKFIIGGVVVGGVVFASRYAARKMQEWQQKEMIELLGRSQRQQHFEKNEITCNQTILSLAPSLCDTIVKLLETESILEKLRSGSGDKVALWEELKIVSFARLVVLLYSGTLFVVLLRVQVNLIGGILYHQTMSEATSTGDTDKKLQEDYLKLCEYFLTKGVKDLCSLIETKVRFILEGESLKKQLRLQDVEHYFWAIQSAISSDAEDPVSHLSRYLLPPAYVNDVAGPEESAMFSIVNDTVDIIETAELKSLATSCVTVGFAGTMDRISEFYIPEKSSDQLAIPGTSFDSTNKSRVVANGLLDIKKVTVPMAKLVPIVNGLTTIKTDISAKETYELWMHPFINLASLKTLGANIYESFSNPTIS